MKVDRLLADSDGAASKLLFETPVDVALVLLERESQRLPAEFANSLSVGLSFGGPS
jgi:hypothetical protein